MFSGAFHLVIMHEGLVMQLRKTFINLNTLSMCFILVITLVFIDLFLRPTIVGDISETSQAHNWRKWVSVLMALLSTLKTWFLHWRLAALMLGLSISRGFLQFIWLDLNQPMVPAADLPWFCKKRKMKTYTLLFVYFTDINNYTNFCLMLMQNRKIELTANLRSIAVWVTTQCSGGPSHPMSKWLT